MWHLFRISNTPYFLQKGKLVSKSIFGGSLFLEGSLFPGFANTCDIATFEGSLLSELYGNTKHFDGNKDLSVLFVTGLQYKGRLHTRNWTEPLKFDHFFLDKNPTFEQHILPFLSVLEMSIYGSLNTLFY